MKRALCVILASLLLLSLAACAGSKHGQEANNTASPAPVPTETQAAAPTEPPVTQDPYATPLPVFPTPGALGKLCEGPIFPEPAKYLVLKGESDLFYVYNNMGELVRSFSAVDDEYAFGYPGFFGEDGICENVRIATGEAVEPFTIFDDFIIRTHWNENSDSYEVLLTSVLDGDFKELFGFSAEDAPSLGECGGVLHIDGKYLVLGRTFDWSGENDGPGYLYDPVLYDEKGNELGTIDPEPFGTIFGVFGDKYIIGGEYRENPGYDNYFDQYELKLFTLDGKTVFTGFTPEWGSSFAAMDEMGLVGRLIATDWLTDSDGIMRDADLNEVDSFPESRYDNPIFLRYGNLDNQMEQLGYCTKIWGSVYVGVMTTDNEWLFKIYNPAFASDSDAERAQWGYWGWD